MGLFGIITVLDGTHFRLVQDLWDEIDRSCGPRSLVPHPYPHFTYQTAEKYDLTQLDEILTSLAARSTPFRVPTSGLAIFGDYAVYVGLPRVPQLERLHTTIWTETARASPTSPELWYTTEQWVPHITLALGPQIRDKVPDIVRLLYRRDLEWQIEINNLTVVYEDETHKELIGRYDFPQAIDPPPNLDETRR